MTNSQPGTAQACVEIKQLMDTNFRSGKVNFLVTPLHESVKTLYDLQNRSNISNTRNFWFVNNQNQNRMPLRLQQDYMFLPETWYNSGYRIKTPVIFSFQEKLITIEKTLSFTDIILDSTKYNYISYAIYNPQEGNPLNTILAHHYQKFIELDSIKHTFINNNIIELDNINSIDITITLPPSTEVGFGLACAFCVFTSNTKLSPDTKPRIYPPSIMANTWFTPIDCEIVCTDFSNTPGYFAAELNLDNMTITKKTTQ